jgi:hypothetical protein
MATSPAPSRWSWFSFIVGAIASSVVSVAVMAAAGLSSAVPSDTRDGNSTVPSERGESTLAAADPSHGITENSSMDEVLRIAEETLLHMRQNLDDYTATLVKQESVDGVLSEANEMAIKVQCTHRGAKVDESEPMRVYVRFEKPAGVAGREVIWAEDLNDGKLVVHEAGLLGLVTMRLDHTGMIAMRGQRYPISEIGLTKLVQKLIERGEIDRKNPDVSVSITRGIKLDGRECQLIVVRRNAPGTGINNFSRAEICFDAERKLPLRYSAYGWGENGSEGSLLESYTYTNIETNVGLTEVDFDPNNPAYNFP